MRKKEPTYFVEKFLKSVGRDKGEIPCINSANFDAHEMYQFTNSLYTKHEVNPKHHTIRAGNRWKVGDKFSPRVWSGKPYNSPQIIIAPDTEVVKVWDFEIKGWGFYINGKFIYKQFVSIWHDEIETLAANDGLKCSDFYSWFKCPTDFKGQIICWNESVNYR